MTDDELRNAQAVTDAAIVGPWTAVQESEHRWLVLDGNGLWVADCGNDPASAKFIAEARTLVPRLIDEIAAMRPVVDAAIAYGMSPSGCHRSESRLVEAAGMYHANRKIAEQAAKAEATTPAKAKRKAGAK